MVRFSRVKKMITSVVAKMIDTGGDEVEETIVSIKGVYSKPIDSDAIVIPLNKGETQNIIFILQDQKELEDGDVIFTDDKNSIHMKFEDNEIVVKTKKLIVYAEKEVEFNTNKFKVNAIQGIDFNGATIKNNSVDVGHTSTHTGNLGYPTSTPV